MRLLRLLIQQNLHLNLRIWDKDKLYESTGLLCLLNWILTQLIVDCFVPEFLNIEKES